MKLIKEPVTSKYNQMLYIKLGSCIYFLRFGGGGQRDRGELHGPGRGYSDITVTEYRAR